jgi:hypothetical protein
VPARAIDVALPPVVSFAVSKIRRGGYLFISGIGDHDPRHVHVYKDGKLIVKWDLDGWRIMQGRVTARVLRLLVQLREEGEL